MICMQQVVDKCNEFNRNVCWGLPMEDKPILEEALHEARKIIGREPVSDGSSRPSSGAVIAEAG